MPLAKLKTEEFAEDLPRSARRVSVETEFSAAPSPARLLQRQLEMHGAVAAEPFVAKWPLRRAVAFIVISSLALWMALITAAAQIYHAIA